VVTADHDQVGSLDLWLREHGVEHGQHAVDVGQDRDAFRRCDHDWTIADLPHSAGRKAERPGAW